MSRACVPSRTSAIPLRKQVGKCRKAKVKVSHSECGHMWQGTRWPSQLAKLSRSTDIISVWSGHELATTCQWRGYTARSKRNAIHPPTQAAAQLVVQQRHAHLHLPFAVGHWRITVMEQRIYVFPYTLSPSLISFMVSVDFKHHLYIFPHFLIYDSEWRIAWIDWMGRKTSFSGFMSDASGKQSSWKAWNNSMQHR